MSLKFVEIVLQSSNDLRSTWVNTLIMDGDTILQWNIYPRADFRTELEDHIQGMIGRNSPMGWLRLDGDNYLIRITECDQIDSLVPFKPRQQHHAYDLLEVFKLMDLAS